MPELRPAALQALALAGATAIVYGPHIFEGGLYSDDWALADVQEHYPDAGYRTSVEANHELLGNRPLYSLLAPLGYALFGADARWHLALAVLAGVVVAVLTMAVLRRLGIGPAAALAIGLLVLLSPWAPAPRLWASAAVAQVAVALLLLGVLAALRGLDARGARSAWWHLLALTAYVASMLVYEATAPAVLTVGALYVAKFGRRAAVRRWAADLLVGGAALAWSSSASRKDRLPLSDWLAMLPDYAWTFGRETVSLVIRSILLVEDPPWLQALCGVVIAIVAASAVRLARRLPAGDPSRYGLRVWLTAGAAALVAMPVAWGAFVSTAYWTPLRPGLESRVNLVAVLPLAVLAFAWVRLAAQLLSRPLGGRVASAHVAVLAAAALIVGYGVRMHSEVRRWDRAAAHAREVLAAVRSLPPLAHGTTIYTFGHVGEVAPRVPVFEDPWDLNGAVRVTRRDGSLRAYPVYRGARLTCGPTALRTELPAPHTRLSDPRAEVPPDLPYFGADPGAAYGRAVFLDVPSRAHQVIDGRRACRDAIASFRPGRAAQ